MRSTSCARSAWTAASSRSTSASRSAGPAVEPSRPGLRPRASTASPVGIVRSARGRPGVTPTATRIHAGRVERDRASGAAPASGLPPMTLTPSIGELSRSRRTTTAVRTTTGTTARAARRSRRHGNRGDDEPTRGRTGRTPGPASGGAVPVPATAAARDPRFRYGPDPAPPTAAFPATAFPTTAFRTAALPATAPRTTARRTGRSDRGARTAGPGAAGGIRPPDPGRPDRARAESGRPAHGGPDYGPRPADRGRQYGDPAGPRHGAGPTSARPARALVRPRRPRPRYGRPEPGGDYDGDRTSGLYGGGYGGQPGSAAEARRALLGGEELVAGGPGGRGPGGPGGPGGGGPGGPGTPGGGPRKRRDRGCARR